MSVRRTRLSNALGESEPAARLREKLLNGNHCAISMGIVMVTIACREVEGEPGGGGGEEGDPDASIAPPPLSLPETRHLAPFRAAALARRRATRRDDCRFRRIVRYAVDGGDAAEGVGRVVPPLHREEERWRLDRVAVDSPPGGSEPPRHRQQLYGPRGPLPSAAHVRLAESGEEWACGRSVTPHAVQRLAN